MNSLTFLTNEQSGFTSFLKVTSKTILDAFHVVILPTVVIPKLLVRYEITDGELHETIYFEVDRDHNTEAELVSFSVRTGRHVICSDVTKSLPLIKRESHCNFFKIR